MLGDAEGEKQIRKFARIGARFVTILSSRSLDDAIVARLHQQAAGNGPDGDARQCADRQGRRSPARARFFFAARMASASSLTEGAMMTSEKMLDDLRRRRCVERPVERDDAAEGRDGIAGERGLQRPAPASAPVATPQGLACLMIATAAQSLGSNSLTSSKAASVSLMLFHDNCLPWSCGCAGDAGPRIRRCGRARPVWCGFSP